MISLQVCLLMAAVKLQEKDMKQAIFHTQNLKYAISQEVLKLQTWYWYQINRHTHFSIQL